MSTAKKDVEELLKKLPDECSLEDVQYHIYVLEKIRNGIKSAEVEGEVTHAEVEKKLEKWILK